MKGRYEVGARVAIRTEVPRGHCRTPFYLRGLSGTVAELMGPFLDPEKMGHGLPGYPMRMLYRVRFDQSQVWPDYAGPAGDTLDADLFEHWLDPAD